MVLSQCDQLLLEGLDVALQVQTDDVCVIQHLAHSRNVRLHCLTHHNLVVQSVETGRQTRRKYIFYICSLDFNLGFSVCNHVHSVWRWIPFMMHG